MKKQFLSFLLLLSFVVSVSAQKAQPARVDALETNLRRHVTYLASDKLEGRRTGERGATYAAGYVANQFARMRLKPGARSANGKPSYMQSFSYTPVRNPHADAPEPTKGVIATNAKAGYNIIGILDGHDRVLKNEAIVIGAHYDHLGRGGQGSLAANSTEIHHGADDNASGTAAIIELARQFAKEKKNKRTIIFIAFSGEEDGLFGSKFYVNNPVFPLDKTVAMINLDMVGRLNDKKLTIGGIGTASEWKPLVESKNSIPNSSNVKILSMPGIPGNPDMDTPPGTGRIPKLSERLNNFVLQLNEDGFGPSDHSSFYGKQIPVLFFFTGTHLDYHKPSDTADKINYVGLQQIVAYVAAIAKAVDENPQRPTYTVAKSANTGGRTGFSISLGTIPTYADSTDGMVLDGVRENSPASRAGLKTGDKMVKLAGKDVKNVYDYTAILGEMKADVEYEVVIVRGRETLTLKITPVKR
ncbi:MAG: M20/M25/M40 family metallo-hydrolase [Pyrinomonadaceae bacterium]